MWRFFDRLSLSWSLFLLVLVLLVPVGALLTEFSPWPAFLPTFDDPYIRHVLLFTFEQAILSTLLSVGLAIPITRALARRPRLLLRSLLLSLMSLPIVLPTIVAVFGIIAIFGYQGALNDIRVMFGASRWGGLYGLPGILLVHVFFNLPLSVRILLPLWLQEPQTSWRLAAQLGMSGRAVWRWIEWPLIRPHLPGLCSLVMLLCLGSFAAVLALGGGPAATTLPVAIYQSLRFDVDMPTASVLALTQLVIGIVLLILLPRTPESSWLSRSHNDSLFQRHDAHGWFSRLLDTLWLLLATLLLLAPLVALLLEGLHGPIFSVLVSTDFYQALQGSFLIAGWSVCVALMIGLPLASRMARHQDRGHQRVYTLIGQIGLAVSPLVLGTGWFMLVRGNADYAESVLLVALVNGVMGVPYLLRLLLPAFIRVNADYGRLMEQLGMQGVGGFRLVVWPIIRKPLASGIALVACLSLGDLGVIALFGDQHMNTLPLLLYQQLGAYRTQDASVTALLLMILIGGLFWLIDRILGGKGVPA